MMGIDRRRYCMADGVAQGEMRRVVVSLDDETFEQVKRRAVLAGHSFAAEVRLLVEMGLETMKEARL